MTAGIILFVLFDRPHRSSTKYQYLINRHNTPYRCSTCSLWPLSSWLTRMISSILPKKSTERTKLRAPIVNSLSIAFLLPLSSWFLQICEFPIPVDFMFLLLSWGCAPLDTTICLLARHGRLRDIWCCLSNSRAHYIWQWMRLLESRIYPGTTWSGTLNGIIQSDSEELNSFGF